MPADTATLDTLINALQAAKNSGASFGERATPSTPATPYYTGPGGLFGTPGLERDIISTRVQPRGLADRLPAVGTQVTMPMWAYLTGFLGETGTVPAGPCDDPQTAGSGKSCYQTAQFGRYSYQTRTLEVNHLGQLLNRGEFTDLRFVNDPLADGVGGITVPGTVPGNVNIRREVIMRMIELGVSFQNKLARQVYEGNPANNNAGGGYREFPGLDILIGTGKIDALTSVACPSLDSDIKAFGFGRLDLSGQGFRLMNMLTYIMRTLRYNADTMNMGACEWVLVMRPELFYEVVQIWACLYLTYRCQMSGSNQTEFVDSQAAVKFRDEMRNGSYLMVDGLRIPVIQDNVIREDTNTTNANVPSGCMGSDIYVIPLTVRGGMPVTYWEYFDYSGPNGTMDGIADARMGGYYWTDGGRYLWHNKPPNNWCIQLMAKIEPRLILRTPHLAGRITDIVYCPLQHMRDPINTDPYFVNGGNSTGRLAPSMFANWGVVTPG